MTYEIQKDELIHRSYLFDVRRLDLRAPGGETIQRDMIRHPGAALVLPVLDDGSIVMIRNYRYPAGAVIWELPCGTLDDGEEPLACAVRELTEESGYTATQWEKLGAFYSCPGYNDEVIHAYLARDLTAGPQELESYEDISVEVLPDAKVRQMAANNEIADAKTLAVLNIYWVKQMTNV
ncbi:MAG: NUDIX hydrolase [Phycisphaerae bacterium]|nr:NUDIX hydrolase [Phycisphaerae bacterium]